MRALHHSVAIVALLALAGRALPLAAAPADGDWVSYRDAYRAMVVFEKYGKPKSLLQHQIQVVTRDKSTPLEGVRLVLGGQTSQLNLPLDATGRTVFPLLKAAYDDNAALVLSRKSGAFTLRARVTLAVRPDGVYDLAELRAACDQALDYARYLDASFNGRHCAGVRFGFGKSAAPVLIVKRALPAETTELRVVDGPVFADDADDGFRIATLRFTTNPSRAQLMTQDAPLAIVPIFE